MSYPPRWLQCSRTLTVPLCTHVNFLAPRVFSFIAGGKSRSWRTNVLARSCHTPWTSIVLLKWKDSTGIWRRVMCGRDALLPGFKKRVHPNCSWMCSQFILRHFIYCIRLELRFCVCVWPWRIYFMCCHRLQSDRWRRSPEGIHRIGHHQSRESNLGPS